MRTAGVPVFEIFHFRSLLSFDAVQQSADGAQHVHGPDHQCAPNADAGNHRVHLPGAEEHREFTGKVCKAGQAATGHERHDHQGAPKRHAAIGPEFIHVQRARLRIQVAA